MKVIHRQEKADIHGVIHIDISTQMPERDLDLVIILQESSPRQKTEFDFTDIAGRLRWKGDAIKAQRDLRDEW